MRTRALQLALLVAGGLFTLELAYAAVGTTPGSYGVSENGTPQYTIPIRVTEGIGELTPRLSVTYVGPGQRTILGVGFALAGISYITPCRKTIAQDINAAPVTLTSADRYCLDGARLRSVSGIYGATNTTYRTELDQLIRATSLGSTGGIPGWFKVDMPNGLKYEYGNTADSKLLAGPTSGYPPQLWAVNKISDMNGNSIVFHYDNDDSLRRFRPNYISYTERNSSGHYRINFVYETGTQPEPTLDFTPSAAGGAAQSDDRLLDRIDLTHDGVVYRKVDFIYENGAGTNKRLMKVQECVPGAPDDCLPETQFAWQNATAGHDDPVAAGAFFAPLPLDINGDGYEDLAGYSSGTWRYMLGGAGGLGATVTNTGVTATNPTKARVLDWNADGRMDLLIDWSDGKWRVLTGTATGLSTSPVHAGPGAGIPSNTQNSDWAIVDINSDGRDDLIRMVTFGSLDLVVRVNGASGFGAETLAYHSDQLRNEGIGFMQEHGISAMRRADFDGDGRTDLLVYACEWDGESQTCMTWGWFQLLSIGTGYSNFANIPDSLNATQPRIGDFNHDGLTDVAWATSTSAQWCVGLGQGGGGFSQTSCGPSTSVYSAWFSLVADYDGDGHDDLYLKHLSESDYYVFRGIGTGLSTSGIDTEIDVDGATWRVLDGNGDGMADIGRNDSNGGTWKTRHRKGLPAEHCLSATDGLGNVVAFTYLPMSSPTVYGKGAGAIYPSQDFRGSWPLVREMQVTPAGGTFFKLTYKYADARVHAQGRSFLGMGKREIADSRSPVFAVETFRQDFPYIGSPATVIVTQSDQINAPKIQEVTHTYANHVLDATSGNQRYLPYRSQTVTNTYEVAGARNGAHITEIKETHSVNTYGNSVFVSIDVKDMDNLSPETGSIYRTEITSLFAQNETDWCIGPPTLRSEKRILPGGTNETRTTSWEVATAQCRVTKETIEPGGAEPLSLVTDLGYDGCGNLDSISSYPAGTTGQQRTTSINHGTRCQRPESITNPENETSQIAYDWSLALPSTQTDPNGLATSLDYDGFGRLIRRDNPDGTGITLAFSSSCVTVPSWCDKYSAGARIKVSQSMRDATNGVIRTEAQFLDGFGRARWVHSDSLESGPAMIQFLYNAFGRPIAQSQPCYTCAPETNWWYWTVLSRDLIGRVTQIDAPINESQTSGRITQFSYEGRLLEVTDPKGNLTTRRSNVIGQLKDVVDPGGVYKTEYAYWPFGELASIEDAKNNLTSWEYSLRGLVKKTIDPDLGTWEYEHNAFGEMTKVRDAKTTSPAWTTQFTFDKLSRQKTRADVPESLTTTWNWGNSAAAKNIGQLASIEMSAGGYAEAYSYDPYGRLSQQSVTADGTTYFVNLAYYPDTGLLDTLQYPATIAGYRLQLKHEYSNGLLKRVKNTANGTVYWEAVSTDAFGHIKDEIFGNGIRTISYFDQASGLMSSREGGIGGGTGLIHSQVDWDLNGNLEWRKDLKLSPTVTEEFEYDSLNRLTRSTRNGGENLTVAFDEIGNIESKLGVGSYDYTTAQPGCNYYSHTQPRAVRKTGASTRYCYDPNGNMTKRADQPISYTSYNLPSVINAPGGYSSTLSYGAFRNRYKQVAVGASGTETTIYVAGLLEKVTRGAATEYRHYIHGGRSVAAIYARRSGGNHETYYLHRDHLGSPELITDSQGAVKVRPSFAAYGERRDGADWAGPPPAPDLTALADISRRGFTGHEHLDAVGLIHMNGRVYEPVAGRFLSRDPFIDGVASSQGINGYAYVHNRPLTLIDPSGFQGAGEGGGCGYAICINWDGPFTESNWTYYDPPGIQHPNPTKAVDPRQGWVASSLNGPRVVYGARTPSDAEMLFGIGDLEIVRVSTDSGITSKTWSAIEEWWNTEKQVPWCNYACAKVTGEIELVTVTNGEEVMAAAGAFGAIGPALRFGQGLSAARGLPNSALVARGGNAANQTAEKINAAIGPSRTPGVTGFSAQCNGGTCLSELGQFLRNRQLGVTTVGEIRAIGGDVIATPGFGHHVTVTGVFGEAVSPLLRIITNPSLLVGP